MFRKYVARALTAAIVVIVLGLVAGSVLGQPVLFSFVTSGSMSPTIQEGDGFVAIPHQVTGDIEEGDVVVFEAQELEGGGLTTHRVVGKADEGYVTRGDGNPFADQDGAEPPVTEDRIVATAWQPGGHVVTIPSLGTAVLNTRSLLFGVQTTVAETLGIDGADNSRQMGSVLLIAGLLLLVVTVGDSLRSRSTRDRTRSHSEQKWLKPQYAVIFLIAVVLVPANATMVLASTNHQVPIENTPPGAGAGPEETVDVSLSATNGGLVTMLVVFDTGADVTLEDRWLEVPSRGGASTTISVPAPPPGEQRTVDISEHRYVLVLPPSVVIALHDTHPLVALGAINAGLTASIFALVIGAVGIRTRRVRDTDRDIPLSLRIKRAFR